MLGDGCEALRIEHALAFTTDRDLRRRPRAGDLRDRRIAETNRDRIARLAGAAGGLASGPVSNGSILLPSGTGGGEDLADRSSPKQTGTVRRHHTADVVDAGRRADAESFPDADVSAEDLLAANPDAVLGVDSGGTIRIANRSAATLFGYAVDQLVGGSIDRLLPASARHRHRPLMEGFFTRPVPRQMGSGLPLSARRRDGEVFFVDISLAMVESPSRGPLAVIAVRDVSQHRRERLVAAQYLVTQALAESDTLEAAAGAVLGAVGPASGANIAALWVVDGFGAIRFVDSWCASDDRLFHAESVDFVFPPGVGALGAAAADPHVHWSSDVQADPGFHRKGLARRLGVHAGVWVPFSDEHGRVLGVLELLFTVVRDPDPGMLAILEGSAGQLAQYLALRRSEAERQRVLGQIVRSVEDERRRIASDLHDDTVQVLVASLLSIDRLDKIVDPANERAHERIASVRDALGAATERTRQLIFELRPQLLEAEGVIPAIAEMASHAGAEAGFAVEVDGARNRYDPAVEALLYRGMQEAVVNARKHSRAARLRCSVHPVVGGVVGEVADDGVGFRVDDALTRARRELSFGLSTILELVRLAGGHVEIRSAPGDGTAVIIRLPDRLVPHETAALPSLQPT
jgi:PAS domain S-box-containing protein